jgi:hypothetical protein
MFRLKLVIREIKGKSFNFLKLKEQDYAIFF